MVNQEDKEDSDLLRLLNSNLTQGRVIKLKLFFPNSSEWRYKRIILLNSSFEGETIYHFLTTTKIKKFLDNKYPEITGNFIFVKKGRTHDNPDDDIVIDCRTAYPIKKNKLINNLKKKQLEFLGCLPEDLLQELKRKIRTSYLIPDSIKEKIL
jgi:hypothetical protein